MTDLLRVSPAQAKQLVEDGYVYVDVRSPEEFLLRHPEGSINVPLLVSGSSGQQENPEFLTLMRSAFGREAQLVVGCATGVRSRTAAQLLLQDGFTRVVEQRAGLLGARSPFGALTEPGWAAAGLPVAEGDDAGSYAAVRAGLLSLR